MQITRLQNLSSLGNVFMFLFGLIKTRKHLTLIFFFNWYGEELGQSPSILRHFERALLYYDQPHATSAGRRPDEAVGSDFHILLLFSFLILSPAALYVSHHCELLQGLKPLENWFWLVSFLAWQK